MPASARRRKKPEPEPPLFHDGFRRKDGKGWGWPWFNQRYGRTWAVAGGKGLHRTPAFENEIFTTPYRPNPILVMDHDVKNVTLRGTFSTSNETARIGLIARASTYSDFYAFYVGAGMLKISRCSFHGEKVLAKVPFSIEPGQTFDLVFKVGGGSSVTLQARAWRGGEPEPSGWTLATQDTSDKALLGRGAFGVFTEHALNKKGTAVRCKEFTARSQQPRTVTRPGVVLAIAGPAYDEQKKVRLVAKSAVPARISFHVGTEPTLTQDVTKWPATDVSERALSGRAEIDLRPYGSAPIIYWRAATHRSGVTDLGPISSMRLGHAAGLPVRFAFGACTRWPPSPRRSFDYARRHLPDFYLHQGDFGYATHRSIYHSPDSYQDHWVRMMLDPHFSALAREAPIGLFQDDEDYGTNNATAASLRPFTIDAWDELTANPPGAYFEFRYGAVAVFKVDCRRFSSGNKGVAENDRSKLGDKQKAWLKSAMKAASNDPKIDLMIVASPQSFGSDSSPASWRRTYENEWSELLTFFQKLEAPVLICSGDAHGHRLHEYPQKNLQADVPRVVEFVSAGTEKSKWSNAADTDVLISKAKGSGFGLVELGPEQDIGGVRSRILTVAAIKSKDGTAHWTPKQYLVVRGVGLLPFLL
jgi:hypothetical protein